MAIINIWILINHNQPPSWSEVPEPHLDPNDSVVSTLETFPRFPAEPACSWRGSRLSATRAIANRMRIAMSMGGTWWNYWETMTIFVRRIGITGGIWWNWDFVQERNFLGVAFVPMIVLIGIWRTYAPRLLPKNNESINRNISGFNPWKEYSKFVRAHLYTCTYKCVCVYE